MSTSSGKRRLKAQRRTGLKITVSTLWRPGKRNECGICREVIMSQADASVDHIVPLADGGKETFRNTRLAHRKCNSEQHHADKMYREQTEERVRQGQMEYIPNASARKHGLWRRHEPNFCAICGDVISTRVAAVLRYRVRLDQGGEDTQENLELIHGRCPA